MFGMMPLLRSSEIHVPTRGYNYVAPKALRTSRSPRVADHAGRIPSELGAIAEESGLREEAEDSTNHVIELLLRQFGIHRQRKNDLGDFFGHREITGLVTEMLVHLLQ